MANEIATFTVNNVLLNTETNIGQLMLPTQTNGKGILIYNTMTSTSPTGCVDFMIQLYKNGVPMFPRNSDLNARWLKVPIDAYLEFGGTFLLTIVHFDAITTLHSFIISLENT